MKTTRSVFLRLSGIAAMAVAVSVLSAQSALGHGHDGPHVDDKGSASGSPGGPATAASSPDHSISATVSFEYFPGGGIKRIQVHCSEGTVPRVDVEGGVAKQSCQPLANQSPRALSPQ